MRFSGMTSAVRARSVTVVPINLNLVLQTLTQAPEEGSVGWRAAEAAILPSPDRAGKARWKPGVLAPRSDHDGLFRGWGDGILESAAVGVRFTPLLAEAARPCRRAVGMRWQVDESRLQNALARRNATQPATHPCAHRAVLRWVRAGGPGLVQVQCWRPDGPIPNLPGGIDGGVGRKAEPVGRMAPGPN